MERGYKFIKGKLEAIKGVKVQKGKVLTRLVIADAIDDKGKQIGPVDFEFKGIVHPDSIGHEIEYHPVHYEFEGGRIQSPTIPRIEDNILKRTYDGEVA